MTIKRLARRLTIRRLVITLMSLTVAICTGGATLIAVDAAGAREREIAAAEALWHAQGMAHYVMTIDELNCMFEVEVQNGRAVRVTPAERCQRDARTVEDLFAVARRDGDIGMRCITLGCACDDHLTVESSFHPRLGYPTRVYVRVAAELNWQHPDTWRYMLEQRRMPECNMMAGDKLLRVVDLHPLP